MHIFHKFQYQLLPPNALHNSSSVGDSQNPYPVSSNKRSRKRKLFYDEDSDIVDIKTLLKQHDINTRTNHGSQIIGIADSRNPLQLSLRKKLVSITCLALMNKTSSTRPSTDQRRQLADCIVEQLFPYMTEDERLNLKDAFFTPSCTFQNSSGKRTSKRPSGFIQSYFVNFWQANKPIPKICNEKLEMAIEDDELSQEEFLSIQEWLKANRGPPAKIFEKLNQSFKKRSKIFRINKDSFENIVLAWPRLFDIDGAIQNDFDQIYPLASDNLFFKWKDTASKLLIYSKSIKKCATTLTIGEKAAEENPSIAALFLLAYLIRPKSKKTSLLGSVESFIMVNSEPKYNEFLDNKLDLYPQVYLVGSKESLIFEDFLVIFKRKIVKCTSVMEAVDLAFKSFYVFNIEFPTTCYGAWQFLDYVIYKMKPICPVMSSVKELAAFVQ
ncbi:uncharacterized protein LOC110856920 isoform X2 [Folsomia candida]|uniref:Uncharacterized protein n=1 Tax=Folsomia candida TaxID=158441 RepID=A0A226DMJ9_FOLCA|nr:uncharacterized protein LOC110856920 isoform X2 [Folsomia candida]OXA45446.1 hypothetical protein Fcan01_19442 [Folsomia candida]